ncbi:MAG: succinate--CoA ligase subunit alpha [Hyphomicrobium sp.]
MAILVDRQTPVICQGMTGQVGSYHTASMLAYGTNVVGGVTPGKGGQTHLGLPVFDTVSEAVQKTGAEASIIFVPPIHAAEAIIEAIDAEVPLVLALTERVPVFDMVRVVHALRGSGTRLIGPSAQGILVPGLCKIGVMATGSERPGGIGIVSRSASLMNEAVAQISAAGLGQSTCVAIGGDPLHGMSMKDCLELFLADEQTEGVLLIGEIGGSQEQDFADFIRKTRPSIPIVALVVGLQAPLGWRMGHGGSLVWSERDTASAKISALADAGVVIAQGAHLVGAAIREAVENQMRPRAARA